MHPTDMSLCLSLFSCSNLFLNLNKIHPTNNYSTPVKCLCLCSQCYRITYALPVGLVKITLACLIWNVPCSVNRTFSEHLFLGVTMKGRNAIRKGNGLCNCAWIRPHVYLDTPGHSTLESGSVNISFFNLLSWVWQLQLLVTQNTEYLVSS